MTAAFTSSLTTQTTPASPPCWMRHGSKDMTKSCAVHAIYGVKHYDPKTGDVVKADIYAPAVLLNEAEFTRRTDAQMQESPGCCILALHARK